MLVTACASVVEDSEVISVDVDGTVDNSLLKEETVTGYGGCGRTMLRRKMQQETGEKEVEEVPS